MLTRRHLLVSAGALLVGGCSRAKPGPAACNDPASLASLQENERVARGALAYADKAPTPEKTCSRCSQWVAPPEPSSCGGCKLLKGPIHPDGSCKAFAAKS